MSDAKIKNAKLDFRRKCWRTCGETDGLMLNKN